MFEISTPAKIVFVNESESNTFKGFLQQILDKEEKILCLPNTLAYYAYNWKQLYILRNKYNPTML